MFGNGDSSAGNNVFISLLVGGIVGAGLALIFAPFSGKKMRRKLTNIADDARYYASEYAKKLR